MLSTEKLIGEKLRYLVQVQMIECFFNKLKYYRRVFSRFDQRGKNYLAFVYFAAYLI